MRSGEIWLVVVVLSAEDNVLSECPPDPSRGRLQRVIPIPMFFTF